MNLGNGGGGNGAVVEGAEYFVHGFAEFGGNGGAGLGAAERRQAIPQFRQVRRQFLAQKIRAGGQSLPQFNEAGTGFVQRPGQTLPGPSLLFLPRQPACHHHYRRRHLQFIEQEQGVMAGEDAGNGEQTDDVAEATEH